MAVEAFFKATRIQGIHDVTYLANACCVCYSKKLSDLQVSITRSIRAKERNNNPFSTLTASIAKASERPDQVQTRQYASCINPVLMHFIQQHHRIPTSNSLEKNPSRLCDPTHNQRHSSDRHTKRRHDPYIYPLGVSQNPVRYE